MSKLLTKEEIENTLKSKEITDWKVSEKEIEKQYEFKDFLEAMKFVNKVAEIAEKENHHPDIKIVWNKVSFNISTHSEGGLTKKDFDLAEQINQIFKDKV